MEVAAEATCLQHKPRLAAFFSGMRHFRGPHRDDGESCRDRAIRYPADTLGSIMATGACP